MFEQGARTNQATIGTLLLDRYMAFSLAYYAHRQCTVKHFEPKSGKNYWEILGLQNDILLAFRFLFAASLECYNLKNYQN